MTDLTATVAFSELSKHSKDVANMVERARRVHVSRRDGMDLILTTERYDRQHREAMDVTTRLLAALLTSDEGTHAVRKALPTVFPWVRYLNEEEVEEFTQNLIDATPGHHRARSSCEPAPDSCRMAGNRSHRGRS